MAVADLKAPLVKFGEKEIARIENDE